MTEQELAEKLETTREEHKACVLELVQECRESMRTMIQAFLHDRYGNIGDVNWTEDTIEIGQYGVYGIDVDTAWDLDCAFMAYVPPPVLAAAALVLYLIFERDIPASSRGRAAQTLFTRYFEDMGDLIEPDELLELVAYSMELPVDGGDRSRDGFYAYLFTNEYIGQNKGSGGILGETYRLYGYDYSKEFRELCANEPETIDYFKELADADNNEAG